jgi:CSLREA domain-containing protein
MLGRLAAISSFSLVACLLPSAPARAVVTFHVNTVADEPDIAPDGFCLTVNGNCSLRAAITEAANVDTVVQMPSGLYALSSQIILGVDADALNSLEVRGAGSGSTVVDAGDNGRHFDLSATAGKPVTLSGLTLRNGLEASVGGSILSRAALTIEDCVIEGNSLLGPGPVEGGGGIYVAASHVDIVRSTIRGNSSASNGGGGIFLSAAATPSTVTDSTISDNSGTGSGGGIANFSTLYLVNSTISMNRTQGNGGGIWNGDSGTLWTYNVTIAFNQADSEGGATGSGGGVFNVIGGTVNLRNSVLGGNFRNLSGSPTLDDCVGDFNSYGFNKFHVFTSCDLTHSGACGGTDTQLGSLTYLQPLRSNGGPTETHAISSDSDLRNAVLSPCTCMYGGELTADQRGGVRPVETSCDIGAFEYGGLPHGLIFEDGFESGDILAW